MAATTRALAVREDRRQLMAHLGDGSRPYTLNEQSLVFDDDITYEEWAEATEELLGLSISVPFWVADALAFGEDSTFSERAAQVLPDGGWGWSTMSNYAWTARAVPAELRRAELTFSHHQEVASLRETPDLQARMLDLAVTEGWSREDLREQVRKVKRIAARAEAEQLPIPEYASSRILVEEADALAMPLLPESVDLIVTSPPYGLNKPYGGHTDEAASWEHFIGAFCVEAYRVARPGGRLALNIPLDTTVGGFRAVYAQAITQAGRAGWGYRFTSVWREGNVSKSVARGSVDSPSAPHVISRSEMIAVFSKGDWKRRVEDRTSDLQHVEWLEWTNGDWDIPGESNPWEGFSAAFPPEIPYRLIRLLSFREDVVLDPFAGSGTTLVVARQLGRQAIGLDNDAAQIASIKRRLAAAESLVVG